MAIHAISDNGDMHYKCLGRGGTCQKDIHLHVTHNNVTWLDESHVQLPPCPSCGAVCTLKVNFTDEEKKAANALVYDMVATEMTLPHAITGEPVPVLIPALKPIGDNPFFDRHEHVAKMLKKHGKHPPQKGARDDATTDQL